MPCLAINQTDLAAIQSATGTDIVTVVSYYQNALQLASADAKAKDVEGLVKTMTATGLIGIGGAMIAAVVKELIGKAITQAVLKAALGTVLSSGAFWIPVVGTILLLLLELALFLANLTREVAGLVVSTLPQGLYVDGWASASGDLYVKHGEMVDFMYDLPNAVNLPGIGSDGSGIATMSFVFGQKVRGFYGIEAAAILRTAPGGTSGPGLAFSFCNPYGADSGVNLAAYTGATPISEDDWESFYDDTLYEGRSVGPVAASVGGVKGTITMNSDSGESSYFALVVEPS